MALTAPRPGLEVAEDMGFQRREWRAERIGWALIALVLLLAAGGVFGNGPVSRATARSDDGAVRVDYQRVLRNGSTGALRVQVRGSEAQEGELQVWVGGSVLDHVELESISPQPDAQVLEEGGLLLTFEADGETDLDLGISFRTDHIGSSRGEVRAGTSGRPARFRQLALP